MQTLFGIELSTQQKVVVASVVILILLILLGVFVRQIQGGRLRIKGQGAGRARQPRLGVVDIHDLDKQRQLILIRRDNVEHLVMIGGLSDVVIETNILRSGARVASAQPDYAVSERPLAVEISRDEAPRLSTPEPPLPDMRPPAPIEPSPRQSEVAAGAAVLTAALAASQAPSFARDHSPAPSASDGELDDMTRQLEEALKRPFSAVRSSGPQAEAAPAPVVPAPVILATVMPAAKIVEPPSFSALLRQTDEPKTPPESVEPLILARAPAADVFATPVVEVSRVEPSLIDAPPPLSSKGRAVATPVDVESELALALGLTPTITPQMKQEALSQDAVTPPRLEDAPEPEPISPAEQFAALFSGHSAVVLEKPDSAPQPAAVADIDETVDRGEPAMQEPADIPASPEPALMPVEPVHDLDMLAEPRARMEPGDSVEPKPEAAPAPIDPFSVDAIEAEFARLLGRDPKSKA